MPPRECFETARLPARRDAVAPDGSDVRVLLRLARGGMAHFELGAGQASRAVAHHHVDEIWNARGARDADAGSNTGPNGL